MRTGRALWDSNTKELILVRDDIPHPSNGNCKFDQIRDAIWWSAVYQTHVNGCSLTFFIQTSERHHLNLYLRVIYLNRMWLIN